MKSIIIALSLLCMFGLTSYSGASASANAQLGCFSTFRVCLNIAEFNFFNGPLNQEAADQYADDVEDCLDEYGVCADPPKN